MILHTEYFYFYSHKMIKTLKTTVSNDQCMLTECYSYFNIHFIYMSIIQSMTCKSLRKVRPYCVVVTHTVHDLQRLQ